RVGDQPVEVLERAEVGMHGGVPTFLGADRPRAARIALRRPQRVVLPLPVRVSDRMDRRQVDDVEAERSQLGQRLPNAVEAAPGAREELVPGAEAREHTVDLDAVRRRPRLLVPVLLRGRERVVHRELQHAEQLRALGELAGQVLLARLDLAPQLVLKRADAVDPRLDPEAPASATARVESAGPAAVAERLEPLLLPA